MSGLVPLALSKSDIENANVSDEPAVGTLSGLSMDSAPVDGVDEEQEWEITGSPGGGTWTATYNGITSGNIAYNASAATVKTALEAMSSIGAGNVDVSGSSGGPYTVTFQGTLAGKPIGALTLNHAFTGGSTPDIDATVTVVGVSGSYRGQAGPSALLHRTDTPNLYVNKGSLYKPEWKAVTTA